MVPSGFNEMTGLPIVINKVLIDEGVKLACSMYFDENPPKYRVLIVKTKE